MDGNELRAWRKARRLSQQHLSDDLHISRDMLANYEIGRTPIPGELAEQLEALEAQYSTRKAAEAAPAPLVPYGHRRMTMNLQPLTWKQTKAFLVGRTFWKYAGVTPLTGNVAYSLFRVKIGSSGAPKEFCTFIQLDVEEWRAFEIAGDRTPEAVANLNQWLDAQQQHLSTIPFLPLAPDPDKTP